MRALFSKEVTVINTSTCPKQQYPLFCSQLTNGQNCLPNSVLQELYSICLGFAVRAQLYVLFREEPLGLNLQMTCHSPKMFLCIFLLLVGVREKLNTHGLGKELICLSSKAYTFGILCAVVVLKSGHKLWLDTGERLMKPPVGSDRRLLPL